MNGPKWKAELEQEGFVHLRQVFGVEDVDRLADLSLRSIDDYSASEDLVRTREGVPLKLLYPLDKYGDFVALLGRREVREIVDTLLPRRESVLTWEDVLIKMPSVGAGVGPHQDIGLDPVRETVHSLGISLHTDEENPVLFLPGSHRFGPLTATAVSALWQECRGQFPAHHHPARGRGDTQCPRAALLRTQPVQATQGHMVPGIQKYAGPAPKGTVGPRLDLLEKGNMGSCEGRRGRRHRSRRTRSGAAVSGTSGKGTVILPGSPHNRDSSLRFGQPVQPLQRLERRLEE